MPSACASFCSLVKRARPAPLAKAHLLLAIGIYYRHVVLRPLRRLATWLSTLSCRDLRHWEDLPFWRYFFCITCLIPALPFRRGAALHSVSPQVGRFFFCLRSCPLTINDDSALSLPSFLICCDPGFSSRCASQRFAGCALLQLLFQAIFFPRASVPICLLVSRFCLTFPCLRPVLSHLRVIIS